MLWESVLTPFIEGMTGQMYLETVIDVLEVTLRVGCERKARRM
jgi:hypothetical protein